MNLIKRLVVGFFVMALVAPSVSGAQNVSDLQAQIQALLAQIQALQSQLGQQSISTDPNKGIVEDRFCYNFNTNLRIGDSGSDVNNLQIALR